MTASSGNRSFESGGRICVVYDCLYPHTVGGAERWYRNLALRLAREGHEVTYLTMRQWGEDEEPQLPGVQVIAVAPRMDLYTGGRRRILPPLLFGLGVLIHLAASGSRYDVVHTASFPYFSLIAAGLVRPLRRYRLVVDWHEVWTPEYWHEYLGPVGSVGYGIQRLCMRFTQQAFCFSRLHGKRLLAEGMHGPVTVLRGQYEGGETSPNLAPRDPVVVFAGRHIPEKQVTTIVPAIARARESVPELRCTVFGDGPDRTEVLRQIRTNGLEGIVDAPGFVEQEEIEAALRGSLCLVLPSRREGYGLVVVEALARGTPAVVVAGSDNAAVELIEEGVNGFIASSPAPEELAAAVVRVYEEGATLRQSTVRWFERNVCTLLLETSLRIVSESYERVRNRAAG